MQTPQNNSTHSERMERRLEGALRQTELEGAMLFVQAKAVAALLISLFVAGWLIFKPNDMPSRIPYEPVLAAFLILQGIQYFLLRTNRYVSWTPYLFAFLEVTVIAYALLTPTDLITRAGLPEQVVLRSNHVLPMLLLLAGASLSYSPRLVLWTGFCIIFAWSTGVITMWSQPDTLTLYSEPARELYNSTQFMEYIYRFNFVDVHGWLRDMTIVALASIALAAAVHRSRRLVHDQAMAERQRGNLARYFSPNVVDELATTDGDLQEAKSHDVAILFADIVGYTALSEHMTPEEVMAFLRDYHTRMERTVFHFGGTLDKFIGDAIMASFGAPRKGDQDAANALRCARGMLDAMSAWNGEREARGEPPVRIGIGLHYGPAVMGDVGSERCAAYSVVGDTTNTASRLEAMTRDLEASVVASQAFLEEVRSGNSDSQDLLDGFADVGFRTIRGRGQELQVWTLGVEVRSR